MRFYHKTRGHELHNPDPQSVRQYKAGTGRHFSFETAKGTTMVTHMENVTTLR
jgi:hypothetical protein